MFRPEVVHGKLRGLTKVSAALGHFNICTVMLPAVSSFTMNTAAKLLQAMRSNPLDWQLAQLQTVARQNGIGWRHVGTSHCVFVRADGKTLPVPARRPIKPIYIKKFLELLQGA